MNVSQDKPSIRSVGQADFASEVLQSGKRVLAVFMALWTRLCQVLEATLNEMVPACDGGVGVVKIHPDDNLCRTPLIRIGTLMRASRKPQPLFVPIASFEFESFVVTVRRFARHQRPPTGIVLSRGTTGFHPVALSSRHSGLRSQSYGRPAQRVRLRNETKRPMLVASVASELASFLP